MSMMHPEERKLLDRDALVRKRPVYRALRRGQDVLLSLLAILILLPLMAVIAVLIWLDDPKAAPIFIQTRVGQDGRPFLMYKFRSMCADAEEQLPQLMTADRMNGPVFKLRNDPRITRFGRFLRASSLDELPQLFNILKGDMSIVGPRPVVPREVAQYDEYQRQRLMVPPGLTCYWQIQPDHNDIPFDEWIELDLRYIRERGFIVDWKIIFATFRAVARMKGI